MRRILLLSVLLAVMLTAQAQLIMKTEYMGTSAYRNNETDQKVGNYKGSSVVHQAHLNVPVSTRANERGQPIMWSVGVGAAYASLTNKNFKENLVDDEILDLYLAVTHIRPIHPKWLIMASVGVGAYSPTKDLSDLTGKQILGNAALLFVYSVKPNLQLGAGGAFNNTFGFPMAFPALYLNWATDGRWNSKINMTNGLEASVGYGMTDFFSLHLIGEITGQVSFLKKDGKDVMFSHQYIVTGLRPEFKLGRKVSVPITVGINAARMAQYDKRTLKAMFAENKEGGYFQVSPYLSAALSISF